jgi:predicted Kef-type K+ transport protein
MAVAWIALPWIMGFADHTASRNFFVIAGIALLGVVALTNYRAAEVDQRLRTT